MPEKSVDELRKERDEASENLKLLLNRTRPKGLKDGLTTGTSNIVQGAVGAAGLAVIGPTVGLAMGLKHGGLLGGVVGVTAGAIGGAVGAVAMALGGAVSGIHQIVRGVLATPESLVAPRQGKWWNEYEGKWVLTKLSEDAAQTLQNVPEDDSDILKPVQDEIDGSIRMDSTNNLASTTVKDRHYYDVLEIPVDAEPAAIKRKYYLLARKYHPDKVGTDDHEAADKFKEVAEAYQVLSDPQLRARYDKDGRQGLSADKTDVANTSPNIDPAILFSFLFGSDQFNDFIGRLSTATSASIGDSPKVSLSDARILQKRRVTRLALKLVEKITGWVEKVRLGATNDTAINERWAIEKQWKQEATQLSKTSYGHQLVTTIGKIYNMLAVMFEGSMDSGIGLPGLAKWAERQHMILEKKKASQDNQLNQLRAGLDMMKLQAEAQLKIQEAQTDEEKEQLAKEFQKESSAVLLRILWTATVVDITSAIHETTKMVFFDHGVDVETRKLRASAVKTLGEIWMETPLPDDIPPKDAAQIYEEAAFAAMVETMNRRDEAQM